MQHFLPQIQDSALDIAPFLHKIKARNSIVYCFLQKKVKIISSFCRDSKNLHLNKFNIRNFVFTTWDNEIGKLTISNWAGTKLSMFIPTKSQWKAIFSDYNCMTFPTTCFNNFIPKVEKNTFPQQNFELKKDENMGKIA